MPNIFNEKGSISDLIGFIKSDILDTYDKQTAVLEQLISSEENSYANALTCRFSLNDKEYYMEKDANSSQYKIFNCDTSKTLTALIDEENDDNTFGLWQNLDELEQSISGCADSSYLMYQLASVCDNDEGDGDDIAQQISAISGHWINNGSSYAKEAYTNAQDTLAVGGNTRPVLIQWLINQYNKLASCTGDDSTGAMEFSDDSYRVQGFTGSYAVGVAFNVISTVVSSVLTVIVPIVGLAASAVTGLCSTLLGMIPDKVDTYVRENQSSNNIYAQPINQGDCRWLDVQGTIPSAISSILARGTHTCTLRMPGWAVVLHRYTANDEDRFQWEAWVSFDWLTYNAQVIDPTGYNSNAPTYKSNRPYLKYVANFLSNGGWSEDLIHSDTAVHNVCADLTRCMGPAGLASYTQSINDNLSPNDAPASERDVYPYFNKCTIALLTYSYFSFFNCLAAIEHGAGTSINTSQYSDFQLITNIINWNNATSIDYCRLFNRMVYTSSDISGDWEATVNSFIPSVRKKYNNDVNAFKALYAIFGRTDSSNTQVTPGLINLKKPRFEPPKYSAGARMTTLALIAGAAAIATAAFVGKMTLKVVQRKKQVARYQKIQQLEDQLKADPDNRQLQKQARKAIKKYNRWANFCGMSRLSAVSGWETGETSATLSAPASLQGVLDKAEEVTQNANYESNSTDSTELSYLIRLIIGDQ